uniref:PX domain-containing protein n=1 Tax=Noctiluca scintillans TaxID=2966 RepID=A0A7S1A0D0_NOCSC|mmetsp:Transcript_26035/g.68377  ORF Transcript_26035/g.68377 Transcript_26035/m.68377 type:complete len:343 (+) Transcript_26035:65-1093(+)
MGKGKGKGKWGPPPPGPWGPPPPGPWGPPRRGMGGVGVGIVAAEAAVVGAVAGACLATAVERPRRPTTEVVVVGQSAAASPVIVETSRPAPIIVETSSRAPVIVQTSRPAPVVVQPSRPAQPVAPRNPVAAVVQHTEEPLRVNSVFLSPEQEENRGNVHFFALDWTEETGASWRVMRRYNEFLDLQKSLSAVSFPDAPFPGKSGISTCKGQDLVNRRRGLEMWLRRVLQHPEALSSWAGSIRSFLQAGRMEIASAPLADAPYSKPQPAASPPLPTAPPGNKTDDSVLAVNVPAGVVPGQVVAVTIPGGPEVNMTVPKGAKGGGQVQVWYDSASGSVTPLVDN